MDEMLEEQKSSKVLMVSDEFVDIYTNFNVYDQVERIKKLEPKERYLLILLCLDKQDKDNPIARVNFLPFKEEAVEIYEIQDDKPTTNPYLLELIELTDDENISTEVIRDMLGNKLPEPLSKEEVRDVKIDKITEK